MGNEPDGMHQTCDPKTGAEKWVTVQKIADSFDPPLRLASPSPCSGAGGACPGGGAAFGKSPWLDRFFEECKKVEGCEPDRIEMIGFHDYEGDFDLRPDNMKVRIAGLVENYKFSNGEKRKVWVTEVSPGCGQTSLCRDRKFNNKKTKIYQGGDPGWPTSPAKGITNLEHRAYLQKILPFFEKSDDVFRYTWYGVRKVSAFNGYPNLLSVDKQWNPTPTPLGQYYKNAAEGGTAMVDMLDEENNDLDGEMTTAVEGLEERAKQMAVTRKRGLGFVPGAKSKLASAKQLCTDAQKLGLGDSWYYTWMARDSINHPKIPGKTICEVEETTPAAEFVPMVLNCEEVDNIWAKMEYYKEHWSARGTKWLLGYNEPDGMHQTCDPKTGAEKWLTVQKIADSFDPPLRLASPSPCSGAGNACPGGGTAFGNSPWLTSFFEECAKLEGCDPDRVEMIGLHDYEGDFNLRPDNLVVRVQGLVKNYPLSDGGKRKVWVTEVSPGCGTASLCRDRKHNNKKNPIYKGGNFGWPTSPEVGITNLEHKAYMQKIIPFFEESDDVF